MQIDNLDKLKELLDKTDRIYNSNANEEIKYDMIFEIYDEIKKLGFKVDWCDPDTSYEEDIQAYYIGLSQLRMDLGNLLD